MWTERKASECGDQPGVDVVGVLVVRRDGTVTGQRAGQWYPVLVPDRYASSNPYYRSVHDEETDDAGCWKEAGNQPQVRGPSLSHTCAFTSHTCAV